MKRIASTIVAISARGRGSGFTVVVGFKVVEVDAVTKFVSKAFSPAAASWARWWKTLIYC